MIYPVYSIYDAAVGFNPPMAQRSEAFAKRAFAENFRNAYSKSDFILYQIGEFDDESGDLIAIDPIRICCATDFMSSEEENGR